MKGALFLLLSVYTALESGVFDLRMMHNWNIQNESLRKALIWEGRVLQFPVNILSLREALFSTNLFTFALNMILLLVRAKDWSLGLCEDASVSAMGNSAHPPVAGGVFLTAVRPTSLPESKQVNDYWTRNKQLFIMSLNHCAVLLLSRRAGSPVRFQAIWISHV